MTATMAQTTKWEKEMRKITSVVFVSAKMYPYMVLFADFDYS